MQQARTHRIACSFDVQSGRYTGARFCKAATGEMDIESVFYLRPPGHYKDRQGHSYEYTELQRNRDKDRCLIAATLYKERIDEGWAEEHARGLIPFDFRQHFVVSFTARSLMHFLDLRHKGDAQPEIRHLAYSMVNEFSDWMPQVAQWYVERRLGRGRLAP
jgi:thymidylate synthase (FAD)